MLAFTHDSRRIRGIGTLVSLLQVVVYGAGRHRDWLVAVAALALLACVPVVWSWRVWGDMDSPLSYQPLVPVGVAFLVWSRRTSLKGAYDWIVRMYPETSRQRKGTLAGAVTGCVLALLGIMAKNTGIAIFGIIVLVAGTILHVYGPRLLRELKTEFLFLLTMVPWPDSIVGGATLKMQLACTAAAGWLLNAVRVPFIVQGNYLIRGQYRMEVVGPCSGMGILFPVLVLTLWLLLWRRAAVLPGFLLLVVGAVFSIAMNVLRIAVMGMVGAQNPELAETLHDANSWLFTGLAFFLTFLVARMAKVIRV